MGDEIFEAWLTHQMQEGLALASASDLLQLVPCPGTPPWRYLAEFRCKGLVHNGRDVVESTGFLAGITFPPDYLRRAYDSLQILEWGAPFNVWHPNIAINRICIGSIAPGTGLVDLLYRIFEVIAYQKFTPREDNALNRDACAWARQHLERFPIDDRPLKWRSPALDADAADAGMST